MFWLQEGNGGEGKEERRYRLFSSPGGRDEDTEERACVGCDL